MDIFVLMAVLATLGTWLVTALGAATVVFFKSPNRTILNLMLGFASGVMIAASFWSLLAPAIAQAEKTSQIPAYIVATIGFVSGALFMWLSDKAVSFARNREAEESNAVLIQNGATIASKNKNLINNEKINRKNEHYQRIIMLVMSITLHNIPEGLAVGVAFGALKNGCDTESILGAVSVAIGIGLQNFPEGAAVSIPLRREGFSRRKCFLYGQASAMVEPIAGFVGSLLVVYVEAIMPYALSFAAGAMILVAVHELIPECQKNQKNNAYTSTMGIVAGFTVMMFLDVMLG